MTKKTVRIVNETRTICLRAVMLFTFAQLRSRCYMPIFNISLLRSNSLLKVAPFGRWTPQKRGAF